MRTIAVGRLYLSVVSAYGIFISTFICRVNFSCFESRFATCELPRNSSRIALFIEDYMSSLRNDVGKYASTTAGHNSDLTSCFGSGIGSLD